MDMTIFANEYIKAIALLIVGGVLGILFEHVRNKRALFTYTVNHNRAGVSADDATLGKVKVTWNDKPVNKLYASTVELVNQSTKDFENVIVRAFTNDTILLTEQTSMVDTTHIIERTPQYAAQVQVPPGTQATEFQINLYGSSRDYLIPIMNRGQIVRFNFLNAAKTDSPPTIWLDIVHKGVRLQYRAATSVFLGVSTSRAAWVGIIIGSALLVFIFAFVSSVWIAAVIAYVLGLVALINGAIIVRAWRWIKEKITS